MCHSRIAIKFSFLVVALLATALSSCTPEEEKQAVDILLATDTPAPTTTPAPTNTPIPLSNTPEPKIGMRDELHDPLNCQTGELASVAMPAGMDIGNTWAEVTTIGGKTALAFSIEFSGVTQLEDEVLGGIEFYNPEHPLVDDPTWYFNTTGNNSANFHFVPPATLETSRAAVPGPEGWQQIPDTAVSGWMLGNVITVTVPLSEIAQTVTQTLDIHWNATTTNNSFSVCDEAGLGSDGLPTLPLPPVAPDALVGPVSLAGT